MHFVVRLRSGAEADKENVIFLTAVFVDGLTPFPEEIGQAQSQLVIFDGTLGLVSPYSSAKNVSFRLRKEKRM